MLSTTSLKKNMPGMLRKQGYATAMFGKWHIGMSFTNKEEKLYKLAKDPGKSNNLSAEHPEIVAELKNLLEASKKSGRSAPGR